ncbi:MAG: DUF4920 domain-containing protein [Planctomycetota bacterium]
MRSAVPSVLLPLVLLCACKGTDAGDGAMDATTRPASRPASQPMSADWQQDAEGRYESFGAPLAAEAPTTVDARTLLATLDGFEGKTVRVEGYVTSTCPKKGCWMNVHGADGKGRIFVRFLDYAFFVPKTGAEGRRVVFEGEVSKREMSVDEARHYLEDAGDHDGASKITKPVEVPFVMATGVRMYAKD